MPKNDAQLELEMCMRLTGALPLSLSAAYFASKGVDHFPINYQKLTADLVLIEKNEDRQKQLFKQLQNPTSKVETRTTSRPRRR